MKLKKSTILVCCAIIASMGITLTGCGNSSIDIMVWQDMFIANTLDTHDYPQDILEDQIAYNLYRIRNHCSLALVCGGNEFNPYTKENAASMFVTERTVRTLVPDRLFHYTTPDGGSAHVYIDLEPVWYRHYYSALPFLAESGLHSMPNFKSLKKLISQKEAEGGDCPSLQARTSHKITPSF